MEKHKYTVNRRKILYSRYARSLAAEDVHRRAAGPRSRAAQLILARCHTAAGLSQGRGQIAQALHFEFGRLVRNAGLFHETLSPNKLTAIRCPCGR